MAMRPTLNYPAAQIFRSSATGPLSTSASLVVPIPLTSGGNKPSFIRLMVSSGAAHARMGMDTSTTAVTSDTIVNASGEALWLNTVGLNYVAFRQCASSGGTANVVGSVASCEEGELSPSSTSFVVG